VKECIERGILKDFLENHAGEVINMLMTEWNWEDALAVHREEGWEDGWEDGWEKGREDGWEKGREDGWEKGRRETAKNLKEMGLPVEQIAVATGLDPETIGTL
jgi:predicted transposase/invertase (TIGR01784 family)